MKTVWDLSFLYTGSDDPQIQKDRDQGKEDVDMFVKKWKGSTEYLENTKILKQALEEYSNLLEKYPYGLKEATYYSLLTTINDLPELKAKETKAQKASTDIFVGLQFFTLSLGKIDSETQQKCLADESLADYHYFLDQLFKNAQYDLSEAEETLLTKLTNVSYTRWHTMVQTFLSREKRQVSRGGELHEFPFAKIIDGTSDLNKEKRDACAKVFNEILADHAPTIEEEYNALLEYKQVTDELRGYPLPYTTSLLSDALDKPVLDALVESTRGFHSLSQRFYEIKAQLLGQEKLAYHERNVPYVASDTEKLYSFEEGVALVCEVFARIKPDYASIVKRLLDAGTVDVFPREGKRQGAFNWSLFGLGGNMVLLNWTDKMTDVTTLAHEMGHAINGEYIYASQPGVYRGYGGSFLAEIASTFFENLVFDKLLSDVDESQKLELLMRKLNNAVSTTIRQVGFFTFEDEVHRTWREKGHLSLDEIGSLFTKHMSAYMGPFVEQSAGSENWWMYVIHLRYFFYNYAYSGGLLLSNALASKFKENHSFIDDIEREYFSVGNASSPQKIFENLGFDITQPSFWEMGYQEIQSDLDEVERLIKNHDG